MKVIIFIIVLPTQDAWFVHSHGCDIYTGNFEIDVGEVEEEHHKDSPSSETVK